MCVCARASARARGQVRYLRAKNRVDAAALSAAAALPFLGKGDPGGPLRKSAAAGDLPGIQKALDAAVWVTPSPARPGSPLCLRSRPPPKPPARAIARRRTTIAEHDMHVRGKLCGASTLAVHARPFAGAAWCPPPARRGGGDGLR